MKNQFDPDLFDEVTDRLTSELTEALNRGMLHFMKSHTNLDRYICDQGTGVCLRKKASLQDVRGELEECRSSLQQVHHLSAQLKKRAAQRTGTVQRSAMYAEFRNMLQRLATAGYITGYGRQMVFDASQGMQDDAIGYDVQRCAHGVAGVIQTFLVEARTLHVLVGQLCKTIEALTDSKKRTNVARIVDENLPGNPKLQFAILSTKLLQFMSFASAWATVSLEYHYYAHGHPSILPDTNKEEQKTAA